MSKEEHGEHEFLPKTVIEISKLKIQGGYYIASSWIKELKMPSGLPDINGALILSDIIYWYRAREVRDEYFPNKTKMVKKFKKDKLQRKISYYSDLFGLTREQVKKALYRLEEARLISKEIRPREKINGKLYRNIMYLEPIPINIKKITYSVFDDKVNEASIAKEDWGGRVSRNEGSCLKKQQIQRLLIQRSLIQI